MLKTGVPSQEDLDHVFPSVERLKKGPIAIFECYQNIPCNPCYSACPVKAIEAFENLNDLPKLIEDSCTGCGICITKCPGLAISIVDYEYTDHLSLMKLPYEFLPLPRLKEKVIALNRQGEAVCEAEVVKIVNLKKYDKTPVVSIVFPKEYIKVVRHFKLIGGHNG